MCLWRTELNMKNVIVTGANGFIGSSLIAKLIKDSINVVALDISFENSRLPQSEFIKEITTDLQDVEALIKRIPAVDYDAFYHFAWAGVNGAEKADPIVQLNNSQITMKCAQIAKRVNCRKFLCAGTIAEKAVESLPHLEKVNGGMMYGTAKHATHLMLETYCKNIGLDFVWMRFSNIYGPKNKTGNLVSYTLGELMKGNEAQFGPATQPYDFIYVDDLIEAILRIGKCDTSKNCYFIGSGEPRTLKDYLYEIGEKCNKKELIEIGARPDDGIVYTLDMFDISELKSDIGDYVSKTFSEGIRYTIENY